jgi:Septum formation
VKLRVPLMLIVMALALGACAGVGGGGKSVFDLEIGDCFDDPTESGEVSEVPIVDCAQPHDNEVYDAFDYDGDTFPGDDEMSATADQECQASFEEFVGIGYFDSELYATHLVPTQESWDNGDREIICVLYEPNEKLTGSMEGAAR